MLANVRNGPPRLTSSYHSTPLAFDMSTGFASEKVVVYSTKPWALRAASSRSVMIALLGSLGFSTPNALPRSVSVLPSALRSLRSTSIRMMRACADSDAVASTPASRTQIIFTLSTPSVVQVLTQRPASVVRAEHTTLLQLRHDAARELLPGAGEDGWRQDEAVTGLAFEIVDKLLCHRLRRADDLRAQLAGGEALGRFAQGQAMGFGALQDDLERTASTLLDLDILKRLVDRVFRQIDTDMRRDQS